MNNSSRVYELGQSLWYDNIERKLLDNGELKNLVDTGIIYGVTSNPSIFNNAISKSNDYDSELVALAGDGKSAYDIFVALAVSDIQRAADLFASLYGRTGGGDGFVSLEVNPDLAHDTAATVEEAKRLWNLVDRPNLMIKIPATLEGIPAIEETIAAGINVNVTLIFSIERYKKVMDAYISGLEKRLALGEEIHGISSVASFFVSRMDSKVDGYVEDKVNNGELSSDRAASVLGKTAIANAKLAYQEYLKVFESDRFRALLPKGANAQRPLWASTSTKNPSYPDTLYVDHLIGPNTVNTLPPKTLISFNDHGTVEYSIEADISGQEATLAALAETGISLTKVTDELEDEGVASFSKAFHNLLDSIEEKAAKA